jgi:hypothetical protein
MATAEMREAMAGREINKKKRKAQVSKKAKKKPQKAKEVSNEESESDWDEGIGKEAEMLDCIKVET